jgi:flagellar assembly factor FliW
MSDLASIDLAFSVPPFGLEPIDRFTLTPVPGADGLFSLVATGASEPRLYVVDAAEHLPDYEPVVSDEQAAIIDLHDATDAMLLVVANPAASGTTVNLLAPIVVNARTGVGAQLILEDQDFPLRAELARA